MYPSDGQSGIEEFMCKQRQDYSKVLNTLVDLIEFIPQVKSHIKNESKYQNLKDKLYQLDLIRLEHQFKLIALKDEDGAKDTKALSSKQK